MTQLFTTDDQLNRRWKIVVINEKHDSTMNTRDVRMEYNAILLGTKKGIFIFVMNHQLLRSVHTIVLKLHSILSPKQRLVLRLVSALCLFTFSINDKAMIRSTYNTDERIYASQYRRVTWI